MRVEAASEWLQDGVRRRPETDADTDSDAYADAQSDRQSFPVTEPFADLRQQALADSPSLLTLSRRHGGQLEQGHQVERRGGESHRRVDGVADVRGVGACGQEDHAGLHVRRLSKPPLLAIDRER